MSVCLAWSVDRRNAATHAIDSPRGNTPHRTDRVNWLNFAISTNLIYLTNLPLSQLPLGWTLLSRVT